jgi:hypothetical protein
MARSRSNSSERFFDWLNVNITLQDPPRLAPAPTALETGSTREEQLRQLKYL